MLEIDGKIFRNLQEQVLKNKEDIERFKELTGGVVGVKGDTGATGPQGPIGPQGLAGSQWKVGSSEPSEGDYWLSTNGLVYGRTNGVWTALMSIRGPQGVKGNKGDIGLTGPQGDTGPQGPQGKTGSTLTIRGAVASVDLLPSPTTQATNTAYLVGSADNYDLYQIIVIGENDDETQWLLVGQYGFINQADVEELQTRMATQETKQQQNEQYISRNTQDIETLQNNVTNLETEHTNINQRITENANNITALQNSTTNLNANKENLIRYVTISSPAGTTEGTLGAVDLAVLQSSKQNCIIFDNQIYRLQDNEHNSGILTYTYNGYDSEIVSKTITITISTLGWVLSELSGGEAPITIVEDLPTANEENYLKGKIYTQGDLLKYIAKLVAEEPNLSQVASLITATYKIGAAVVGTNVYLFGGIGPLNTINKFDTTTNTLTTLGAILPSGAQGIATASVGTNIYLFGGRGSSALRTINKFDTTTETITTLSETLPEQIESIAAAVVGTNVYLFGGSDDRYTRLNTINKFDTTTNTLTTLSSTIPTAASNISAAVVGTNVYLFGGYPNTGKLNTINKFDTTTNTLTTLSSTIPTAAYGIAAASVGTNIYLFGGYGDSSLSTINKFDTTTNTLTTLSVTLPTAAFGMGTAVVGTNVYLFGGYGDSSLSTIYKAQFGEYYQYKTITAE